MPRASGGLLAWQNPTRPLFLQTQPDGSQAPKRRREVALTRGNVHLQQDLCLHPSAKGEGKVLYMMRAKASCWRAVLRANQLTAFLTWHRKSLWFFLSVSFFSLLPL